MVKILNVGHTNLAQFDGMEILRGLEYIGRVSYQSESKMINEFDNAMSKSQNMKEQGEKLQKLRGEAVDIIVSLYNKHERNYTDNYKETILKQMILDASALKFMNMIVQRGHLSVIEHFSLSVRFVCDRGVSHEIVRHRLASFTQESTRYCNYSQDKFGNEIKVIKPLFFKEDNKNEIPIVNNTSLVNIQGHYPIFRNKFDIWLNAMEHAESHYFALLKAGASPQEARSVLPNSLKTEIVVTANLREWSEVILPLRVSKEAHPQMREIMIPLLRDLRSKIPVIFDDIKEYEQ